VKIWIDADACPRVIKEILFRASERLKVPVCLVANNDLSRSHTTYVTSVRVPKGFDVADDYIAEHALETDLVITADIPLAARVVERTHAIGDFATLTPERAIALAATYDLQFLVTEADLPLPVAYRNTQFRIYALRPPGSERP